MRWLRYEHEGHGHVGLLQGDSIQPVAASSLFGVLNRTVDEGSNEMLLVQAQEEFVKPRRIYAAKPVAK